MDATTAVRRVPLAAPTIQETIGRHQNHGVHACHDELARMALPLQTERAADITADPRSGNAGKHGGGKIAWICARENELGDHSGHQAQKHMPDLRVSLINLGKAEFNPPSRYFCLAMMRSLIFSYVGPGIIFLSSNSFLAR